MNWYGYIFVCNAALEGLNEAGHLSSAVKDQLIGEALFLRAFFYFYLINLYGDVPLAVTTDYKVNSLLARSKVSDVYQQIIEDLQRAQNLLSDEFLDGSLQKYSGIPERLRPTKWAATALLARVYLFTVDYAKAEEEASSIINHSSMFSLVLLNDVFLMNSDEAIWQLQPVLEGYNIQDGWIFIIPESGPSNYSFGGNPVYLSANLLSSFEAGDQRKSSWVDTTILGADSFYFPYKYKIGAVGATLSEYQMALRLGEQYLIRAEARAQMGNLTAALEDINVIRLRAGLGPFVSSDPTLINDVIFHERQVELFTEWGHRWLDLKRTGKIDEVMPEASSTKGGIWNTNWQMVSDSVERYSKGC